MNIPEYLSFISLLTNIQASDESRMPLRKSGELPSPSAIN